MWSSRTGLPLSLGFVKPYGPSIHGISQGLIEIGSHRLLADAGTACNFVVSVAITAKIRHIPITFRVLEPLSKKCTIAETSALGSLPREFSIDIGLDP